MLWSVGAKTFKKMFRSYIFEPLDEVLKPQDSLHMSCDVPALSAVPSFRPCLRHQRLPCFLIIQPLTRRSQVSFAGRSAAVLGLLVNEPSSGTAQVLASSRDRITTTPSIMMNMMTIMIAIY